MFNLVTKIIKSISKQRFLQLQGQLNVKRDKYNAVHINLKGGLGDIDFQSYVDELMKVSLSDGTSSVWVHLQELQFKYATYLTSRQDFSIHHGKGKSLSLYRWLSKQRQDMVVPYSMFHIGCGGIIIRDNKILLIQEKRGEQKGKFGIPGGRSDHGEGVKQSAERQVFEQLGIKTQFKTILWMRQISSSVYDAFDVYYACLMEIDHKVPQNMKICDYQIQKAEWVDLKDYRQFAQKNSFGTQLELANYICDLHENGYDFTKNTYQYRQRLYTSPLDGKTRFFGHHRFFEKHLL